MTELARKAVWMVRLVVFREEFEIFLKKSTVVVIRGFHLKLKILGLLKYI